MSFLDFFRKKPGLKFPTQIRKIGKPKKDFYERAKAQGNLSPEDLKLIGNHVFRIDGVYEVTAKHKRQIEKLVEKFKNQNNNAMSIWSIIESEHVWKENFINALAECVTNGDDPRLNFLYGELLTILDAHDKGRSDFLNSYKSLRAIHNEAKKIDEENKKERKAKKYAKDLILEIDEYSPEYKALSREHVTESLKKIFRESSSQKWHDQVYPLLEAAFGKNFAMTLIQNHVDQYYDQNNPKRVRFYEEKSKGKIFKIIDDEFLSKINPEASKTQISEDFVFSEQDRKERVEKRMSIWELFSREDLEEESAELDHCVGEDDTYYNKIRRGEVRIFSIREDYYDEENDKHVMKSRWTIEAEIVKNPKDPKDKSKVKILQFRGFRDIAVGSEMLTETVIQFKKVGIEITGFDMGDDVVVFEKKGEYKIVDDEGNRHFYINITNMLKDGYTIVGEKFGENKIKLDSRMVPIYSKILEPIFGNKLLTVDFYNGGVYFQIPYDSKVEKISCHLVGDLNGSGVIPWSYRRIDNFLNNVVNLRKAEFQVDLYVEEYLLPNFGGSPIFKNLENVEEEIVIKFKTKGLESGKYRDGFNMEEVEAYVTFHFPKLIQKYGSYEALIASRKIILTQQ